MADPTSNVVITGQDTGLDSKSDAGTPTGPDYNSLTAGTNGQVKGTAGNDKATLDTLLADKDQIINLGGGDDIFIFRSSGAGSNHAVNGIVDGGIGADLVYLAGELSDYIFSIRSDGGIKFQYGTDSAEDGSAVTFRNFESFKFRGIDQNGQNHFDQTLSYDELIAAIHNADQPTL